MPVEYLTPAIEDRAVVVQALLADRGQHRAVSTRSAVGRDWVSVMQTLPCWRARHGALRGVVAGVSGAWQPR
jgi:hypothetical protein